MEAMNIAIRMVFIYMILRKIIANGINLSLTELDNGSRRTLEIDVSLNRFYSHRSIVL